MLLKGFLILTRSNLKSFFINLLFQICFGLYPAMILGQVISNGQFEGAEGFEFAPPEWTIVTGTPDVLTVQPGITDELVFEATGAAPSPQGGNCLLLAALPDGGYSEAIEQQVSGFIIGETYTISYWEAHLNPCTSSTCYDSTGEFVLNISGLEPQTPGNELSVSGEWYPVCMEFVATSETLTIGFASNCLSNGDGCWIQLDDVQITQGSLSGENSIEFDYPFSVLCSEDDPILPNLMGNSGGFFFATPEGLDIDSLTGLVDPNNSNTGNYTITYTQGACVGFDTFDMEIIGGNISALFEYANTSFCLYDEMASPIFDIDGDGVNDGSIGVFTSTPGLAIISSTGEIDWASSVLGTYTITNEIVFEQCGTSTHQVEVTLYSPPELELGSEISVCFGEVELDAQNPGATYEWQDGSEEQTFTVTSPGTYSVTVTVNGCETIDEITVFYEGFTIDLGEDILSCDQSVLLDAGVSGYTYEWQDGTAEQQLEVTESGVYTVLATNDEQCTSADTISVEFYQVTSLFEVLPQSGCDEVVVSFESLATSPFGPIVEWQWDFGNASSSAEDTTVVFNEPGVYNVSLTSYDGNGCAASYTLENVVQVWETSIAQFTYLPNQPSRENSLVEFENQTEDAVSALWVFENNFESSLFNPTVSINDLNLMESTFSACLYTVDSNGCEDSSCQDILVANQSFFYFPNSFTPNNDNLNDLFGPVVNPDAIAEYNFAIFNRWGETVFYTEDVQEKWNGSHAGYSSKNVDEKEYYVPDNTYVWLATIRLKNEAVKRNFTGHVTLLR